MEHMIIRNRSLNIHSARINENSYFTSWKDSKARNTENFLFKIEAKKYSKTPEPGNKDTNPKDTEKGSRFDFRSSSRKNSLKPRKKVILTSISPRRKSELLQINEIKRKLANRNVPVSAKCLENGLSLYEDLPNEIVTPKYWPKGGELLIKEPIRQIRVKSTKMKRKRRK